VNHDTDHNGQSGSSPPPYVSLKELSRLSGLSVPTLRGYCNLLEGALPCYRPSRGKIIVKWAVFEAWLAQHETVGPPIEEVLKAAGITS